jgi:hypothetical protein
MARVGDDCKHVRRISTHLLFELKTTTESISSLVGSPSGDCIYVTARVMSWSGGRSTVEMLPADESKVVETNTFEGEARTVTLAVALETPEVLRMKEVPRRTRKN